MIRIMEQVADWEVGTGRTPDQESNWTKSKKMVVSLPDGKTKTIGISQVCKTFHCFCFKWAQRGLLFVNFRSSHMKI